MSTQGLALLISVFSAAFTLGGLVWQVTLYRLSGARLEVRLISTAYLGSGSLVTGKYKVWQPHSDLVSRV